MHSYVILTPPASNASPKPLQSPALFPSCYRLIVVVGRVLVIVRGRRVLVLIIIIGRRIVTTTTTLWTGCSFRSFLLSSITVALTVPFVISRSTAVPVTTTPATGWSLRFLPSLSTIIAFIVAPFIIAIGCRGVSVTPGFSIGVLLFAVISLITRCSLAMLVGTMWGMSRMRPTVLLRTCRGPCGS